MTPQQDVDPSVCLCQALFTNNSFFFYTWASDGVLLMTITLHLLWLSLSFSHKVICKCKLNNTTWPLPGSRYVLFQLARMVLTAFFTSPQQTVTLLCRPLKPFYLLLSLTFFFLPHPLPLWPCQVTSKSQYNLNVAYAPPPQFQMSSLSFSTLACYWSLAYR